jgi:MFS family permease
VVIAGSLKGLNWLNLLVALMQTGFGAFLSVYLTTHGWSAGEIGFALSLAAIAAMVAQVPGGMLVDAVADKRRAAGVAILVVVVAALVVAIRPTRQPVLVAEVLQGAASGLLTPSIAAITLALAHKDVLGERLGSNVRFAALGSVFAAAVMGVIGTWYSHRATLFLAALAGLASLVALAAIRATDLAAAHTRTDHRGARHPAAHPKADRSRDVACDPCLLIFGLCVFCFHLGNASLLPLAANALAREQVRNSDLIVAAAIVVPQLVAAMLSPRVGRFAQLHGRRIVLIAGFLAMSARAVLFACDGGPGLIIAFQTLDGISAAAMGVLVPLIVADITHHRGRFNLAMGIVGLFMGVGAALSTTLSGALADRFGNPATFALLALPGLLAALLAWRLLPETRHRPVTVPA